jgi:L-ectoine synthase
MPLHGLKSDLELALLVITAGAASFFVSGQIFSNVLFTFLLAALFYLALWGASLAAPPAPRIKGDAEPGPIAGVLRQPHIWSFLLVCFLMLASHGPYYTFFSIYLQDHGYSGLAIGSLWALGVVAEVGVFLVMHRLLPRFGARRLLLANDGMGFSLHDTVLYEGTETHIWYRNHLEAVYCIEGEAEIEEVDSGKVHRITPGTMYALNGHERHYLRVIKKFRVVCVFYPPLTGNEVHDESGAYALHPDAVAALPKIGPDGKLESSPS